MYQIATNHCRTDWTITVFTMPVTIIFFRRKHIFCIFLYILDFFYKLYLFLDYKGFLVLIYIDFHLKFTKFTFIIHYLCDTLT